MNVLKPFYYDKFECIGEKCKDSCCLGWNVFIDKKTFNQYKKISGPFKKELNDGVSRNRKDSNELHYGKINLEQGRCKFLNDRNLCDIYINLGENYLCNTCKQYPRLLYKFGEVYEKTLNLSCPEVARILVETNEIFSFDMNNEILNETEKQYIQKYNYNKDLYNLLWEGRSLSIEVAQFREIDIWKRLVFIKIIEERLQENIENKKYDNVSYIIEECRQMATSYERISSLDNLEKVTEVKIQFISILLRRKINERESNKTFLGLMEQFEQLTNNIEKFNQLEEEFNSYFEKYEYVLESYIVYSLYNNYMKALVNEDLNKCILILILSYSTIKILLMARWKSNNKNLSNDDIVDVLYSFSRVTEHNNVFMQDLYDDLKNEGYISLAYLTILVR
ncbi:MULTISPECIES: flagellin lysine-N-methylase [Clostridium]|uniref:flagellin lysine-N-methylase n=1 Tax=Clostridium TaxID=1485 RepID=UPI002580667A|nr:MULTISPECIES: flagellin lysine-N-methylase [Clostridium]MBS4840281.1 flagellin lysine-N-methylase [Clostridium sp.]MDU1401669.1 flagellin lysine-N-methylase [Clostridium sp.]MDU1601449.1 flagellin lysine-N-methylase [Clostridium sp.]MDU2894622.1 flagellin lysine-N-methylase [Clostridium sp.]MDU3006467.1 flagellin lysine-N-methylase [Clostridium sp.]